MHVSDQLHPSISVIYIYWATKDTLRLYIPTYILFETKISENIFLIKYEHYNV